MYDYWLERNKNMSAYPIAANEIDFSRLRLVTPEPLNAETILTHQAGGITPTPAFYLRNHLELPSIAVSAWKLTIAGAVNKPLELTYDTLRGLPERTLLVTLECAGNGRAAFHPPAEGEDWHYGAVSTAEWTGTPLRAVLELAGLRPTAREVMFEGADHGSYPKAGKPLTFARSLLLAQALHPDTLLAYAMNGEPLPTQHGFPVRLVVPGWYAMASVKWIRRIEVIEQAFQGFFQVDQYIMAHPERGETAKTPLSTMRVRSLITTPAEGATLPRGRQFIRGLAWSGAAQVKLVEVSTDGGATWEPASFTTEPLRYAWRAWEYLWDAAAPGPAILQSRAFDEAGNTQPETPEWNRLGYANNAIQHLPVVIS